MADCATTAAATDSMLSVRIGGAIGIFLVSSVGVMLPMLAMTAKLERVFFVLRAIGAGVVLATGFVHVLGGAHQLPIRRNMMTALTHSFSWHLHAGLHVGMSWALSGGIACH